MIDIETHQGVLTITGRTQPKAENETVEYLHRGIAERGFERRFQLADHVKVNAADLSNGLLTIQLEREIPDALKPKKIAINGQLNHSDKKLIPTQSGKSKKAA